ncbi:MAG: nitrous oxide reductase family maturation protein NosD [Flavobacteriales bacterium]|jgi:nitrous oxidase accessory protein|nr:nitrous oxide reductase family maturation protein NosD [Flavobacteriales bacterium]
MKKILTTFFLCLFIAHVYSQDLIVCKGCKLNSIKRGIDIARPHDTIYIKKDTYLEHDINIEKPITIIGNGATVDAEFKGGGFDINTDSIFITDLIINNIKSSYTKDIAGIYAFGISHFIFEKIEFNHPFFAFLIQRSNNGIIRENTINGDAVDEISSGNGIHLWKSENIEIYENTISQMRDGIYLEFVGNSFTYNNISRNQIRYGLHFMFSNNNSYKHNLFENNSAGVAVMFSKNIIMENNTFKENWGTCSYGLLLKEIYDAEISNNLFDENTIGINAEGSTRINYFNNIFKNNGWAIKITGGCFDNIFYVNDFLNNTFDISYQGRQNGNTFNGNYWTNYTGYDIDRDGFGDTPYRPVKLFSYIVNRTPETIILHRSLFVDIVNFSEKVSPIFTPKELQDLKPALKQINYGYN